MRNSKRSLLLTVRKSWHRPVIVLALVLTDSGRSRMEGLTASGGGVGEEVDDKVLPSFYEHVIWFVDDGPCLQVIRMRVGVSILQL